MCALTRPQGARKEGAQHTAAAFQTTVGNGSASSLLEMPDEKLRFHACVISGGKMLFYQHDLTGNEPEAKNGASPILRRNAAFLRGAHYKESLRAGPAVI